MTLPQRVRRCLQFAPAERLAFAPDCGLSQTARWAARRKLANMVGRRFPSTCGAGPDDPRVLADDSVSGGCPSAGPTRALASLVARAERLPAPVAGTPFADGPVFVGFADEEVCPHRQAARAHDGAGGRTRTAGFYRCGNLQPQPHGSSRRRDLGAAAARESRIDA